MNEPILEEIEQSLHRLRKNNYNAYITVLEDLVKIQVNNLCQQKIHGPMTGWTVAVKDNIAVKNAPLTCASKLLENFVSPYSATVVTRMIEAGAVIMAKTNMDEFGMGSTSENSAFGRVCHPLDPSLSPGGSSGGSAVSVATGDVRVALGSDTGGSVRQPAAFCGVYGLRPTYGCFSRYGLVAFSSSLDQIGPMAKTVDDLETVFNICSGFDSQDMTSGDCSLKAGATHDQDEKFKFGIFDGLEKYVFDGQILQTMKSVQSALEAISCKIQTFNSPDFNKILASYHVLTAAEAVSNLARFHSADYKIQTDDNRKLWLDHHFETRSDRFGEEVKRRLLTGAAVLSAGYRKDLYSKAHHYKNQLKKQLSTLFQKVDFLIMPTTPQLPFQAGKYQSSPVAAYSSDCLTVMASLAGYPALTIPYSLSGQTLPLSFQIMAPPGKDRDLFNVARLLEKIL